MLFSFNSDQKCDKTKNPEPFRDSIKLGTALEQVHSAQYCSDLVKSRDEDRWLAARYAGADDRRKLLALYAFHVELTRIPAAVSEPPLGEIRLQWWREAFDEIRAGKTPRAHPVVQEIAYSPWAGADFEARIAGAIDAAARLLYGNEFTDANDLSAWLAQAEAYVDVCAYQYLGGPGVDEPGIDEIVSEGGVAFALAREGAAIAPALAGEAICVSREKYKTVAPALRLIKAAAAPALLHLALTPAYLHHGRAPFAIKKRVKLFAAMAVARF